LKNLKVRIAGRTNQNELRAGNKAENGFHRCGIILLQGGIYTSISGNLNRKPLQFASEYSEWELRFGPKNRFRVIYRFSITDNAVYIGAIGEKQGNRVYVAGEEVKL
jgi:hypothetical protein